MKNTIRFTVIENGNDDEIETYFGEYKNLMFLLRDQLYLDSFGECSGMGRCATCVIKITGLKGNSITKDRNEPATLSKLGFTQENIRLSCQLPVSEDLNGTEIDILEL